MITSLRLGKFQGFSEELTVPLAPITLIYGPNGSGKSSILRALRFLQQTVDHENLGRQPGQFIFTGESINLMSFANAVHRHDVSGQITIGVKTSGPTDTTQRSRSFQEVFETIEFKWVLSDPGQLEYIKLKFVLHRQLGSITFKFQREGRSISLTGFSGAEQFSYLEDFASRVTQIDSKASNVFGDYEFESMGNYFTSSKDVPWEKLAKSLLRSTGCRSRCVSNRP